MSKYIYFIDFSPAFNETIFDSKLLLSIYKIFNYEIDSDKNIIFYMNGKKFIFGNGKIPVIYDETTAYNMAVCVSIYYDKYGPINTMWLDRNYLRLVKYADKIVDKRPDFVLKSNINIIEIDGKAPEKD